MRLLAACLVLASATVAATFGRPAAAADAAPSHDKALVRVPPGASPIAKTTIDELRGFPEMSSTSAGRQSLSAGRLIDTTGFDRLFESDRSYAATVAFFDESLNQRGNHVFARTVTNTATAWAVRKPGETIANVIVRDTRPVTFEIEESLNEAAGIRVH